MSCERVWRKRVRDEILTKYPEAVVLIARAYNVPRIVETTYGKVAIPGVEKSDDPPVQAIRRFLASEYRPGIHIQFVPFGGFAWAMPGELECTA